MTVCDFRLDGVIHVLDFLTPHISLTSCVTSGKLPHLSVLPFTRILTLRL